MEFKISFKEVLKAILFNPKCIDELSRKIDLKIGLLALFASSFLLSIPTEGAVFSEWGLNLVIVFVGLFLTLTLIFGFMKAMKSETDYERFLALTSLMIAASLFFISLPVLLIFEFVLKIKTLSVVLFSLVPYYNFLILGYSCEVISYDEKGFSLKRIAVALFSMTLIFLFYFLLSFITF